MTTETWGGRREEEPFDTDVGIGGEHLHRPGDRAQGREDGEVSNSSNGCRFDGAADGGRRRLEPHSEEDDLPVRRGGGQRHRIERRVDDADLERISLLLLEGGGSSGDPK